MIILGPKTAILWPQFCRILVLGPKFWWSGGARPPPDPPLVNFWNAVRQYINDDFPCELKWNFHNVFLNEVHVNDYYVSNLITCVAKHYLYRCGCLQNKLNIDEFIRDRNN